MKSTKQLDDDQELSKYFTETGVAAIKRLNKQLYSETVNSERFNERLEEIYQDDTLSYSIKRRFAYQHMVYPASYQWGYTNLKGNTMKALANRIPLDNKLCDLALTNPHWTPDTVAVLITANRGGKAVLSRFVQELDCLIMDEDFIVELLAQMRQVLFVIQKSSFKWVYRRARQVYDFDPALPDSWVQKALEGSTS